MYKYEPAKVLIQNGLSFFSSSKPMPIGRELETRFLVGNKNTPVLFSPSHTPSPGLRREFHSQRISTPPQHGTRQSILDIYLQGDRSRPLSLCNELRVRDSYVSTSRWERGCQWDFHLFLPVEMEAMQIDFSREERSGSSLDQSGSGLFSREIVWLGELMENRYQCSQLQQRFRALNELSNESLRPLRRLVEGGKGREEEMAEFLCVRATGSCVIL